MLKMSFFELMLYEKTHQNFQKCICKERLWEIIKFLKNDDCIEYENLRTKTI